MSQRKLILGLMIAAFSVLLSLGTSVWGAEEEIKMSEGVTKVEHDPSIFGPDPSYEDKPYDYEAQLVIYGGKKKVKTARPLFELGDRLYWDGPVPLGGTPFGSHNPNAFWFMAFGDWRTAVGYNNRDNLGRKQGTLATKLNLDFDMRLTATERIHAFLTPLDEGGRFTRVDFDLPGEESTDAEFEDDLRLDTLFFEGDFGPIFAGLSGKDNALDLPFSFGLVPMFTQNGVWVEDAFTGFAITPLSAKNSAGLGISNYDVTFFAAFDEVTTNAVQIELEGGGLKRVSDDNAKMYGAFGFAEANRGYWEFGYGYLDSDIDGLSYHNLSVAHTRRIRHVLSNSVRVIANFGQEGLLTDAGRQKLADGFLLLLENSWITSKPSTVVPYFNFFFGFDSPQALARAAAAGGVLKNTGINFEGEAITAMPNIDPNANNTAGGAIGLQHLFNLDQQLVAEFAFVIPHGDDDDRVVQDNQFALGIRYQRPVTNAWIIRTDFTYGLLSGEDEDRVGGDLAGIRFEVRRKF